MVRNLGALELLIYCDMRLANLGELCSARVCVCIRVCTRVCDIYIYI